jgi:hypothetical protein
MNDKLAGKDARLPEGLSFEEEAEWWEQHRDFWDADDAEWEVLPPQQIRRTQHVDLWLPVDLIDTLRREAEEQGTSYQILAKRWLDERAAAEKKRKKSRAARSANPRDA